MGPHSRQLHGPRRVDGWGDVLGSRSVVSSAAAPSRRDGVRSRSAGWRLAPAVGLSLDDERQTAPWTWVFDCGAEPQTELSIQTFSSTNACAQTGYPDPKKYSPRSVRMS